MARKTHLDTNWTRDTARDFSVPDLGSSPTAKAVEVIALSPGNRIGGKVYIFRGRIVVDRGMMSAYGSTQGPEDALNGAEDPCNLAIATKDKDKIEKLIALHPCFKYSGGPVQRGDSFFVQINVANNRNNIQGPIPVLSLKNAVDGLAVTIAQKACESLRVLFEQEDASLLETIVTKDSKDIDALHPNFKILVEKLISNMETRGFKTNIITTFRSIETQAKKVKQGRSETNYGYHNFVNSDGQPASQAADLTNARAPYAGYGPDDPKDDPSGHAAAKDYFLALGEEAAKLELDWGGNYSRSNPIWAQHGMGWDPAHVELKASPGATLAQAKDQARAAGYTTV